MEQLHLLAIDIGASNGRGILGLFDGMSMKLQEVHRFENGYVERGGMLYWDAKRLLDNIKECLKKAGEAAGKLDCFGIDTWGVDFGLLDGEGRLLGDPRCYRHTTDADAEAAWEKAPCSTLFARTGTASLCFNTVYQLYKRIREGDGELSQAKTLLLMPDLFGYLLTGTMASEYTNASTTMLYNPQAGDWDRETMDELGIPAHIFTAIDRAGTLRGALKPEIGAELGIGPVPFAAVGTHDTASAVAAIPAKGSFAFISSGTWSLFGTETEKPLLTKEVYAANFSNEGTVQGGFRPLKNIMGMWLIQECRREWLKENPTLSWDGVVEQAQAAEPLRSIIDPDYSEFFRAGDMPARIRSYCARMGQPVPDTVGRIARCVYESLALKYRWATERLEEIKGEPIRSINIVGGGAKNALLNQMTADASGRRVIAGPFEGTAMGNLLLQAAALGRLKGIDEIRDVVRASTDTQTFESHPNQGWEDAYGRLKALMEIK